MKENIFKKFIKNIKETGIVNKKRRISLGNISLNEQWKGKLDNNTETYSDADPVGGRFKFEEQLN